MPQFALCDQWRREVTARGTARISGVEQSGVASLVWAYGDLDSSDRVDLRGGRETSVDGETDRKHAGVCAGQAYGATAGGSTGRTLHRWIRSRARLQGTGGTDGREIRAG